MSCAVPTLEQRYFFDISLARFVGFKCISLPAAGATVTAQKPSQQQPIIAWCPFRSHSMYPKFCFHQLNHVLSLPAYRIYPYITPAYPLYNPCNPSVTLYDPYNPCICTVNSRPERPTGPVPGLRHTRASSAATAR